MTMPNFLIIGAAKCGTTSLHKYLAQHPEVFMSSVKEPRFFAFEGEKLSFTGPKTRANASITTLEDYHSIFDDVKDEKAIGESSPIYIDAPKACLGIKKHIPQAKLIAILRNPVDRAYSQFSHQVRDGKEPLIDFAEALKAEPDRIASNWGPLWYYSSRGFYYKQLKPYFENFDRHQLKIYLFEDLVFQPFDLIKDIFTFLEVDNSFIPDMSRKYNVSGLPKSKFLHTLLNSSLTNFIKNIIPKKYTSNLYSTFNNVKRSNLEKQPLQPQIKQTLLKLYREDTLKLQDLLQRDLSAWLK